MKIEVRAVFLFDKLTLKLLKKDVKQESRWHSVCSATGLNKMLPWPSFSRGEMYKLFLKTEVVTTS